MKAVSRTWLTTVPLALTTTKNSASNGKNRQINYAKALNAFSVNSNGESLSAAKMVKRQVMASASWHEFYFR